MPIFTVEGRIVALPDRSEFVDLETLPGRDILRASDIAVEELSLPHPVYVQLEKGHIVELDRAWRITIRRETGEFGIGALPWMVWINDTPLLASQSPDLGEIRAITFDPQLIKDGANISVSYGSSVKLREDVGKILLHD